jgi:hypothetical protein
VFYVSFSSFLLSFRLSELLLSFCFPPVTLCLLLLSVSVTVSVRFRFLHHLITVPPPADNELDTGRYTTL